MNNHANEITDSLQLKDVWSGPAVEPLSPPPPPPTKSSGSRQNIESQSAKHGFG
jgi:hypothetical protein